MLTLGMARPAAPCVGAVILAPPAILSTQSFTDALQPATNLFVCRVDGAPVGGAGGTGTRSVTSAGLALLVLARWLHFAGFALGFGTICFGLWIEAVLGERLARLAGLWRLVHVGIGLLLCAEPLALLAQTVGVRGALFDPQVAGDVLASGFGLVWAQRIGVALLLWVIIGVVKDGTARAVWAVPALGLALVIVDSAASATTGALAFAATMLHEAAMAAWIGGLALLLALWASLDRDQSAAVLARFSRLSASAIGTLIISGLVLAGLHLTQPVDLFATLYGATLMFKLLAALVAIGLATFGARMYQQLWRWRAALAALVVLLGVAGLLVSLPSP